MTAYIFQHPATLEKCGERAAHLARRGFMTFEQAAAMITGAFLTLGNMPNPASGQGPGNASKENKK
jgi:hypothetical protein